MELSRQSVDEVRAGCARLLVPEGPWVFKAACDGAELASALSDWRKGNPKVSVFVLDGSRMRTAHGLYDEFKRKLALPDYFGRNLNALSECLTDAAILKGDGFVILLNCGSQLLLEEGSEMAEGVLEVLKTVGAEWAEPLTEGNPWDRAATPFHSIVQFDERLTSLGALPSLHT